MTLKQMIADMQAETLPTIPQDILQIMLHTTPQLIKTGIVGQATDGNDRFELPMPATYVVRSDGTVAAGFVHEDYTQRMEPSAIIECLERG